jgi:hypothetical protein
MIPHQVFNQMELRPLPPGPELKTPSITALRYCNWSRSDLSDSSSGFF